MAGDAAGPVVVLFCHSILSDWNNGNAHFLRGVVGELRARGCAVRILESAAAWSPMNLLAEAGERGLAAGLEAYPWLPGLVTRYDPALLDLDAALDGADLVIVHEWTETALVAQIGARRAAGGVRWRLLFHDTHHRALTRPAEMAALDLRHYDGALIFGEVLRRRYLEQGWVGRAWTWHEAADTSVFVPLPQPRDGDLVWVGNWGDGERSRELGEFLLEPAAALGLRARVFGVRYPRQALAALRAAGVAYGGWLPNSSVPRVFGRYSVTVHVPRRPYARALPGIPTIRVFEALACGIPLVCSPWEDAEGLFAPGEDYLVARDGSQMRAHLRAVLADRELADALAAHGLATIRARHSCAHRVDQLLTILEELRQECAPGAPLLGDARSAGAPAARVAGAAGVSDGRKGLRIAFFGSSLVSAYWNGAATYYRGMIKALYRLGHHTTFYEPEAYDRQAHRDIADPPWAQVVVYSAESEGEVLAALEAARGADLVVKASGVGVFDALLEEAVLALQGPNTLVAFWDVDAPATLDRLAAAPADPFRRLVPRYDLILTYGGGDPVVRGYRAFGARHCIPIYNALDPETHHPVPPDPHFAADLGLLANRLPDREARVEEFFLGAAVALPGRRFLLGGNGWADKARPANVRYLGHVYTGDHNAFNCTPLAVLNIARESMARYGFSPATRVFEAAGAAACLITDRWEGIEQFLEPEREVLVAETGHQVADLLQGLTPGRARAIGGAARARALAGHTYAHRAAQLAEVLGC